MPAKCVERFHVPSVIALAVHATFRRQKVKRRKLDVAEFAYRPTELAVCLGVALHGILALPGASKGRHHINASSHRHFERHSLGSKGTFRVPPHRCSHTARATDLPP